MKNDKYDLEERTLRFSEEIISICKEIKITSLNRNIIDQLLRSATSIGANYREANGAVSKKDFSNKIHICKKEAKESYYWLCLLTKLVNSDMAKCIDVVARESKELLLIFSKIAASSRQGVS